MNPETVQKLNENVPEFKELLAFLRSELAKLDTLSDLASMPFKERAYEVTARLRAKETLIRILGDLLGTVDKPVGVDPAEYVV